MEDWLESGLEEIKVPKDESYLSKILPELKALKERINHIISDHISAILPVGRQAPARSYRTRFYRSCRGSCLDEEKFDSGVYIMVF